MRNAAAAVWSVLLYLFVSLAASAQTCPNYTYLNLAYTGTNCSSSNVSSRCAVGAPVTFSIVTPAGTPYSLQSCETGVVWEFTDGSSETTPAPSITHTFASAGNFWVHASVSASTGPYNGTAGGVLVANGTVSVATATTTVSEAVGSVVVSVHTTYAPTTVTYNTGDSYGGAGTRYTPIQGTLSFAPGEFDKTVTIPILDDNAFTGSSTFDFEIHKPTNGVVLALDSSWILFTIVDDETPPIVDFDGTWPKTISEAIGNLNVDIVRTGDIVRAFTVDYSTSSPVRLSGTLYFNPNDTKMTISIPIAHDSVWSPPRQYAIAMGSPSNGAVVGGTDPFSKTVSFTVVDDTPAPVVKIGNASVVEGDTGTQIMTFPVTLSTAFKDELDVTISMKDVSATANADYTPIDTTLEFAPGETAKSVTVIVKGDTQIEPDEMFAVTATISDDYSNYITVTPGTGTIMNDDNGMAWIKVAAGEKARMQMVLGNTPAARDSVALTSSKTGVATVPASFPLATQTRIQSFEVTGVAPGTSTITAKLPASEGGVVLSANVDVYTPATLSASPELANVAAGGSASIALTFSPAPSSPLDLKVTASNANVQAPAIVTIDTTGHGTLLVKGVTAGDANVTVTQPDANGGFATTVLVHVTGAPAGMFIASALPPNGPTAGGTQVTLAGQNFTSACTVIFGGAAATNVTLTNPTTLTATTPPHPAATVDVVVTCGSDSYTLANGFTYAAATAQLSAVAPAFGSTRGGTLATVTGSNIRSSCGVQFGGTNAKIVSDLSPDKLVVLTPTHATSESVDVTLQCGAIASTLKSAFTYSFADEPSAVIADVDPLAAAPGQNVTITGVRFRPTDAVTFDNSRAIIVSTTPTAQLVTVPALAPGPVAVTLTDANGHATTTGPIFTILEPVTPEITSVQPLRVAAGGEITIIGKGFRAPYIFVLGKTPAGTIVDMTFNRAAVRIASTFGDGTYTVGIANASGNLAAVGPKIEIGGTVNVTSVSPQCAVANGGSMLTITGSGFTADSRVWVDGSEITGVTVANATTIQVTVPEAHLGWMPVRVVSPSGDSDTLTHALLYYSPFESSPCTTPSRSRGARH